MTVRVHEQILRLDVPVADTKRVNVAEGTERLIRVQFYEDHGYGLFHFVIVLQDTEDSFRHIFHYNVEVDLVILVSLRVERMLKRDHIRMIELLHDL